MGAAGHTNELPDLPGYFEHVPRRELPMATLRLFWWLVLPWRFFARVQPEHRLVRHRLVLLLIAVPVGCAFVNLAIHGVFAACSVAFGHDTPATFDERHLFVAHAIGGPWVIQGGMLDDSLMVSGMPWVVLALGIFAVAPWAVVSVGRSDAAQRLQGRRAIWLALLPVLALCPLDTVLRGIVLTRFAVDGLRGTYWSVQVPYEALFGVMEAVHRLGGGLKTGYFVAFLLFVWVWVPAFWLSAIVWEPEPDRRRRAQMVFAFRAVLLVGLQVLLLWIFSSAFVGPHWWPLNRYGAARVSPPSW